MDQFMYEFMLAGNAIFFSFAAFVALDSKHTTVKFLSAVSIGFSVLSATFCIKEISWKPAAPAEVRK